MSRGLRWQLRPHHRVPATLGSCTVTASPAGAEQHPTQLDAPESLQPQCHRRSAPSSACSTIRQRRAGRAACPAQPQQQAGSPWALFSGRTMAADTQSEGLSLLSHRHPPQSRHGPPGPCQPPPLSGSPSDRRPGSGRNPRPPGLRQPWCDQRGTAGSGSARRVKHRSRTGSITSARLHF